jgi:Protein kinase domain
LRAGGVKLLDFGIAKALGEPEVEKTGQGLFKGKLSYIAPERIKDLPIDGRSDLFSLGVVLWELLAGQKLFRGKSDFQTLKNVTEMEVPAPSSLRPDVPPELDRIVARALARDPAERYATGQEMADDLDRLLATLRYQPRALPDLLEELFGDELSAQPTSTTTLTPEMLAACATDTSSAVRPTLPAAHRPLENDEYSISIGTAAPARQKPGWMSWAAASIGTATLLLLLLARGGGGRSQGATLSAVTPVAAAAPEMAAPAQKVIPPGAAPPASPEPAPPASDPAANPALPLAARPGHRARWSGKGRIARGLSVDPFAEAASRVGR